MPVNRRTKKRIDKYLQEIDAVFDPDKAREIREYIEHLEACVEAWQKQSGEKHPTIGF